MIVVNVSGNITADAIAKNINGTEVVNFTVASTNRYTTKEGELKEDVTFMNCQLWNRSKAASLLFKGRGIAVTGTLRQRSYVNSEGQMQRVFDVRVSEFQVFGKKQSATKLPEAKQAEIVNDLPEAVKPQIEDVVDDLPF